MPDFAVRCLLWDQDLLTGARRDANHISRDGNSRRMARSHIWRAGKAPGFSSSGNLGYHVTRAAFQELHKFRAGIGLPGSRPDRRQA